MGLLMQILAKVGSKYPNLNDPKHALGWRDGQIVDIRPSGFYTGKMIKKHFAVIELPNVDYWQLRGDTNWKSTKLSVLNLKKYLAVADINGKHQWDGGYIEESVDNTRRKRDYFLDFQWLLDQGHIDRNQYNSIYDKNGDQEQVGVTFNSLDDLFRHEDFNDRLNPEKDQTKGTVSTGTYSIGSGLDYETVTAFEADIEATLTGNLTGEHANEETAISAAITFEIDTDGGPYLFKLTAASGAEHSGAAYGNGARINYGTSDVIIFNESGAGSFDDAEVSKIAFDISGSGNTCLRLQDGSDDGLWTFNRLLIKGDSNSAIGIDVGSSGGTFAPNVRITNGIIYGISVTGGGVGRGIRLHSSGSTLYEVLNNSFMKNRINVDQVDGSIGGAGVTVKNNLVQGGTTSDFNDSGGGFGTTAKNISEDATSPDNGIYDNLNCHDATSSFIDYANDDYRLVAGGGTDSAIIDDGDDLSGIFTDDVIGTTRSTWWIGAYELAAVGGLSMPVAMHHYTKNIGSRN